MNQIFRWLNIWILCIMVFITLPGSAQPQYEAADYATVGDSFLVSNASLLNLPAFNFEQAGNNITWDYSGLTPASQQWKFIHDPDNTGFMGTFLITCEWQCYDTCYNNCIDNGGQPVLCSGQCTVACGLDCVNQWNDRFDLAETDNDSIDLNILVLKNIYDFFDVNPTGLYQVAIGATVSGFPLMVNFEGNDRQLSFPVAYGNIDSSQSGYTISLDSIPGTGINASFTFRHRQKRINTVEGWGTLITPFGTIDSTLKIRSVIHSSDTVVFNGDTFTLAQFLPGQIIPDKIVEFKWLHPRFGYPLLEVVAWDIAGTLINQRIIYMDSLRCFEPRVIFGYLPFPAVIDSPDYAVEVTFYDLTINADFWFWKFGDTISSNPNYAYGQNPSHTYTAPGVYTVTQYACNSKCDPVVCDSFSLPVIILGQLPDTTTYILPAKPDEQLATLYPNPSGQQAPLLKLPGGFDGYLYLYDLTGRMLLKKHITDYINPMPLNFLNEMDAGKGKVLLLQWHDRKQVILLLRMRE